MRKFLRWVFGIKDDDKVYGEITSLVVASTKGALNDLEGQVIRNLQMIQSLQKNQRVQDVIAPHLATLSVMLKGVSDVMIGVETARRELQDVLAGLPKLAAKPKKKAKRKTRL